MLYLLLVHFIMDSWILLSENLFALNSICLILEPALCSWFVDIFPVKI